MDKKSFKSKPYHLKQKHSGDIEKTIHSADTDIGAPESPADLRVYGTARFDDPALAANAIIFGHRLSVSGSSPVPIANVPSSSVLYLTPHMSEFVGLYFQDRWQVRQTSMVTKSLSELTASNLNYDVFVYWDTTRKVIDLDFWPWSGDRTRENGLARKDGVYVKHDDPTRRYAGTVRTVAAGRIADTASRRFVWNFYNRLERYTLQPTETTDSWTYSGTTYRAANGQMANSFEIVTGDPETIVATARTLAKGVTGWGCTVGIGVNSTTVNSANIYGAVTIKDDISGELYEPCHAEYANTPTPGYNRFHWLEISGGIVVTWMGDIGNSTFFNFGITGRVRG